MSLFFHSGMDFFFLFQKLLFPFAKISAGLSVAELALLEPCVPTVPWFLGATVKIRGTAWHWANPSKY